MIFSMIGMAACAPQQFIEKQQKIKTGKVNDVSSPKSSEKTEDRIIELIRQDSTVTTEQLGKLIGISKRAVLKQFYEGAVMGEEVAPEQLYEIKAELDASGIYLSEEVVHFCDAYFKPKERQSAADHRAMNSALDPAVSRFRDLQTNDADAAELWRGKLYAFRNLYAFLSQIIPYQDSDLERLYTYLRHLASKLPKRSTGPGYHFDDDVRLEYYRLQK